MKHVYKIALLFLLLTNVCWAPVASAAGAQDVPILILGVPGHFDAYTGEILKAEGFNEFTLQALTNDNASLANLQKYDVVILTEATITNEQAATLTAYVKKGGGLITFKPDDKLAPLFGIKNKRFAINNRYIVINATSPIAHGLIKQPLQLHTSIDIWQLHGSEVVASAYGSAAKTAPPAVVMNSVGNGRAIAFLYNLPQNIVYTRQGNPLFAGLEKDSIKGLRAMDLFAGGWVDTSNNTINQADEQMHLLSHCIEYLCGNKKPLPRLWYFPDTLNCLVTLTNDGEYRAEEDFQPQFTDIEAHGAKMALYILSTGKVSKQATDEWLRRGNEISGHPDDTRQAEHPAWDTMTSAINTKLAEMNNLFGIAKMRTLVNHWFVWCGNLADGTQDFTAQAKIELAAGVEMDINYAHYDNNSSQPRFLGPTGLRQGNYTGSGLPMKFSTANGALLNIYQHFNNVYDQQYMEHKDSSGFFDCFKGLMDRSLNNEVCSYISIKSHNDEYFFSKTPLLKMLDYAKQHNVPVWTPVKLLDFLKAKDEARFTNVKWNGGKQLSFYITTGSSDAGQLSCMVPTLFRDKTLKGIAVNGKLQHYTTKQVKGSIYALISVTPGCDYVEAEYAE